MSAEIHPAETGRNSAETRETVAESTMKFDWLVAIKGNLDAIFADDPNVFVAGANLICANAYDWKETIAPSVYVAFGRPKKKRGQYKVWTERGIFPQVVFEVRWLGTNEPEMMAILRHGIDKILRHCVLGLPIKQVSAIFLRQGGVALDIRDMCHESCRA